jgi:hypothetical protein
MNKLLLAITLAATAAAIVPANAEPRNNAEKAQMFATSPGGTLQVGKQCWKPTDQGRGYGYWTTCDQVYAFARGRVGPTINREALDTFARADLTSNRGTLGTATLGTSTRSTVGLSSNAEIEPGGGTEGGGGGDGGGGDGGGR